MAPDLEPLAYGVFFALLIGVALAVGVLTGSGAWGAGSGFAVALLWVFVADRVWPERETTDR